MIELYGYCIESKDCMIYINNRFLLLVFLHNNV